MSTNRRSTPEARSRRRKAVVVVIVAALLLAVWIVIVAALAGGDGEQASDQRAPDQRAPDQRASESGAGPDPQGEGAGSPDGGSGDGSSEEGSSEDGSYGGASERELEEVADETLSPPPGGGTPEGEIPIEDEEGRSNGQRGFVSSFIGEAYGYTGEDVKEYRSGYESRIETDTYYDSAGGAVLEDYAELIEDEGAENAAIQKDYRIRSGEPVETEVNAKEIEQFAPPEVMKQEIPEGATVSEVTYAVGDRYGDTSKDEDFGDVYGDVDYLKQRLFLSREEGAGWRIIAASAPQQTQNPDADRPEPGANKVGEPEGHGTSHGHDHGDDH